jgi:hypothetical protein
MNTYRVQVFFLMNMKQILKLSFECTGTGTGYCLFYDLAHCRVPLSLSF